MVSLRTELSRLAAAVFQEDPAAKGARPRGPELAQRLLVHQYGFEARTRLALERAFPRTVRSLGERRWRALGRRYAFERGNLIHNLNQLGRDLPQFLAERRAPGAAVELASLEWLEQEVLASAAEPALSREELAALNESSCLRFQPHVRWFVRTWGAGRRLARPQRLVLARRGLEVRSRAVPKLEWVVAERLREGRALGEAVHQSRLAPARLSALLARWFKDELVCSNV